MSTDTNKSSRDIERDIARTRTEINETVDAIQDRLSPDTLIDRAVDYLRDGSTRSKIAQVVRDNPLAAVLIGIGVGWLLLGLRQQTADGGGRMNYAGAGSIDQPYRPTDEPYRSETAAQHYRDRAGGGDDGRAARGTAYRENTEASPTSVPDLTAASAPLSGAAVTSGVTTGNPASPNVGATSRGGDVSSGLAGNGGRGGISGTPGGTSTAGVAGAAGTTPASSATTLTSRAETRENAAGTGAPSSTGGGSTMEASTAPVSRDDESRSTPSVTTASTSGSAMETTGNSKTGTGGVGKRGERKPSG